MHPPVWGIGSGREREREMEGQRERGGEGEAASRSCAGADTQQTTCVMYAYNVGSNFVEGISAIAVQPLPHLLSVAAGFSRNST